MSFERTNHEYYLLFCNMVLIFFAALLFVACDLDTRDTLYTYYNDDKSSPKEIYEVNKETGKLDGKYKCYYENGHIKEESFYKDGILEGEYKKYYENGQMEKKFTIRDGRLDGKYKRYNENGKIVLSFTIIYGKVTDPRDSKIYKTVKIGSRTWMAENLNYITEDSYCYDDTPANCEKYGRLYEWGAATESCPLGWHLPTKEEFKTLIEIVDLKGIIGFSALPAGNRDYKGVFNGLGDRAFFWSASAEIGSLIAYNIKGNHIDYSNKSSAFSVRCLLN